MYNKEHFLLVANSAKRSIMKLHFLTILIIQRFNIRHSWNLPSHGLVFFKKKQNFIK